MGGHVEGSAALPGGNKLNTGPGQSRTENVLRQISQAEVPLNTHTAQGCHISSPAVDAKTNLGQTICPMSVSLPGELTYSPSQGPGQLAYVFARK